MATLTIRVTSVCSGGNHYTVTTSGEFARTMVIDATELRDMDAEDVAAFVRGAIFLAKRNRTLPQLRAALQAGITVTA